MNKILTTAKQMLSYPFHLIKGKTTKAHTDLNQIKPGQGAIVELNGRKTAVYKDEQGNVTKLSPTCTHMGCTVEWNNEASEWLCPCHQSHFAKDGKVLSGPAKRDLQQIQH